MSFKKTIPHTKSNSRKKELKTKFSSKIDVSINPFKTFKEFKKEWYKDSMNQDDLEGSLHVLTEKEYFEILEDRYEKILATFNSFPNEIKIYRSMVVENAEDFANDLKKGKYVEKYKGLGVFWSYDEYSTDTFWKRDTEGDTIDIQAVVNKNDVDWKETIIQNLSFGEEESEIYLDEGTNIKVLGITILDEYVNDKKTISINKILKS